MRRFGCPLRGRQIQRQRMDLRLRMRGLDFGRRILYARFGAAVDDDARPFAGQRFGDGQPDAGSRAGDESEFSRELKVHR